MTFQVFQPFQALRPFTTPVGGVNALAALIKALFGNDEAGGLWLPGPDTCFTDTAGTTAAGVGDTVARINDSSGNGNHATQATVAARPALGRTVEGGWYLAFDGVDDGMLIDAALGTLLNSNSLKALSGTAYANNSTAAGYIFHSQGSQSSRSVIAFALLTNVQSHDEWVFRSSGENGIASSLNPHVTTSNIDKASDPRTGIVRFDGSEVPATVGTGNPATEQLTLGFRAPSSPAVFWSGKFFGAAISLQHADAAKTLQLEQFLAARAGITL